MYTQTDSHIHFNQSKLPRLFFLLLGQLDIYITLTGSKIYPYAVEMSESDFLSTVELAKEL